jgi:hypothetical protein
MSTSAERPLEQVGEMGHAHITGQPLQVSYKCQSLLLTQRQHLLPLRSRLGWLSGSGWWLRVEG